MAAVEVPGPVTFRALFMTGYDEVEADGVPA